MDGKIAVLIPCYNESATIAQVIHDFHQVLPGAEIYVYDNNSTDGSADIARKAGAIVHHEYRQGKGNVVRSMFRNIEADCYVMVDGDNTYPAENAPEMCRWIIEEGVDMVIGDRLSSTYFTENKRAFHNSGNKFVCYCINKIFKSNIRDVMTGFRAFSYRFVKHFPVMRDGFELETEMTIHALDKKFLIHNIPVKYQDRPVGSTSKLNTRKDGFKVIRTIFCLFRDYKPMLFFNLCALFLLLVAFVLALPIVIEYLHTGLVARFPTLFVALAMSIIACLLWVCGIILNVVVSKHRQLFEILLNKNIIKHESKIE